MNKSIKRTGMFLLIWTLGLIISQRSFADNNEEIDERRYITATYCETPPVIDGNLSDVVWQLASPQGDFHRRDDPDRGGPARVETNFRILYDEEFLYIGCEMNDDNPEKLLKSITKRDENIDLDDSVCLYIDTFNDERSAYMLQVNSIGTQRDLFSTGNGKQVDMGWDALWYAVPQVVDDGWTVEFKLPFKIFRFNWSDHMTWGLEILRVSIQREEWSEWCYIEDNENNTLDPRLYGKLNGLSRVRKPRMMQIISSLVGSHSLFNRTADPYSDENGWDSDQDLELGLDFVWNVTPMSTLNLTVNPDFAQIEADPDQLNLTGEEIYLQERRPFFRENNAIFMVPGQNIPFYTRRIVDIFEGLKFTGQYKESDYAFLFVHGEDRNQDENYVATARTQTPVFNNFTLSTWFIEKYNPEGLDNYVNPHGETYKRVDNVYNLLFGLDSFYRVNNWHMVFSFYSSHYPDETRAWYTDKPTGSRELILFELMHTGNNWTASIDYKDTGIGFYPELGFTTVSHLGSRCVNSWLWMKKPFPEDHLLNSIESYTETVLSYDRTSPYEQDKIGILSKIEVEFDNNLAFWVQGDFIEDKTFERFNDFTRDKNGNIINSSAAYFGPTLGRGNNDKHLLRSSIQWTDGGWKGIGLNYIGGRFYYSRIRQYSFWLNWVFGDCVTSEFTIDYLHRYQPTLSYLEYYGEWEDQTDWIFRNKITYTGIRDLYGRVIISGYLDDYHLSDQYDLSILLEYTYLPDSKIYVVYENSWIPYDYIDDVHLGLDELKTLRQTIYFKITYMVDFS